MQKKYAHLIFERDQFHVLPVVSLFFRRLFYLLWRRQRSEYYAGDPMGRPYKTFVFFVSLWCYL